jgi:hypothetical protein
VVILCRSGVIQASDLSLIEAQAIPARDEAGSIATVPEFDERQGGLMSD